jgi:AraC-like DNA-binding protein
VDGDASDWSRGSPPIVVERPGRAGEPRARATVRLAWDRNGLWALFEVVDPTFHAPPAGISGPALFQWDSVELYLDGRGDREPRMGSDDFQVILSPDGRAAALQGDPLLREIESLEVPKRERPSLAIEAAGRRTADGYVVECAIPFAALGIVPAEGREFALDLALNDWLDDHPPLEQLAFDLDTLHRLDREGGPAPEETSHHGLAGQGASRTEKDLYRPWSWTGGPDSGHPRAWRPARLVGAPPLAERLLATWGPARTLVAGGLTTVLLVAGALGTSQWRHRRRLRLLLARITELEASPPAPADPSRPALAAASEPGSEAARSPSSPFEPAHHDPLDWLARIAERDTGGVGPESFELRAMRAARARRAEPLTPARLAAEVCVSLRTLERHLAATLSCTPGELILAVKMREARHLLGLGGWQVQEVAHRVGFDDPSHFSRRYKSYFGEAPAATARAAAARARPPAA